MFRSLCAAMLWLGCSGSASAAERPPFEPDIAYTKHILPNGLTLLVHADRKAPLVAVNVWYKVGSRDEQPGRTGFAHLFEHLMFKGSKHHDDEYFRPLEAVGASSMNGTTSYDRTNYFQTVPTSALDLALWLESDRMGHLLPALTQKKLDVERDIVLNEKRDGESAPYGKIAELLAKATYPAGHPYAWTPIGSEADVRAATLDEVKRWFTEHYGAANAVLVVAGDVDAAEVRARVEHYFGEIPAGPPRTRHADWVAKMQGTQRMTTQDRVAQARLIKVWNVPGFCTREANLLGVAAEVLAGSKTSRLHERLVYRERLATSVSVDLGGLELGSQFLVDALVAPGVEVAAVERAIDEELARFLEHGPTAAELAQAQLAFEAAFVRGLERIDGFGGKSATLAEYEALCGAADWYQQELRWIAQSRPRDIREVARAWISDGQFVLRVDPLPETRVAPSGADRSRLPDVGPSPALQLPRLQHARLSNGIPVALAERGGAPVVQLVAMFDAGAAADSTDKPGIASLALDLLDEGAGGRDALAFARRKDDLAASISTQSNLDASFVLLNSLRARLPESLELFADVLRRPSFPAEELERLRERRLAAIRRERLQGFGIVSRLYPPLVYGADHAYGGARSGSGTEASVSAITLDDLRSFHARWLRPDNARLLVVGDLSLEQALPLLERAFGGWQAPREPRPPKNVAEVKLPASPRVFLVDKPDASQSLLLGVHLAPPMSDPDDLAMEMATSVLGGLFVSRLNLNLREDKQWSYGADATLGNARGQRPFVVSAQVQQDRTADSLREMVRELREITGDRPIDARELRLSVDNLVIGLPAQNETSADLASSYLKILQFGLEEDYYNALVPKARGLDVEQVNAAAQRLIRPQSMTWLVVGDLSRIEASVRALQLGEVKVLDASGAVLR